MVVFEAGRRRLPGDFRQINNSAQERRGQHRTRPYGRATQTALHASHHRPDSAFNPDLEKHRWLLATPASCSRWGRVSPPQTAVSASVGSSRTTRSTGAHPHGDGTPRPRSGATPRLPVPDRSAHSAPRIKGKPPADPNGPSNGTVSFADPNYPPSLLKGTRARRNVNTLKSRINRASPRAPL